jgi:hypothetical protein
MSSKQPSTTTTTTKQELPSWAVPYSQDLLKQGANVAQRPYEQYTGQRIAGWSPVQESALYMGRDRATQGNQAMNAGQGMLEDTLSGKFLSPDSNPYFRNTVDQAMDQTQGRVNTQFNRPGAFGSTAHQDVMTKGLGDIANQMYSQNYMNERGNQMGAANQALAYGSADWQNIGNYLGLGDKTQQLNQSLLDEKYQDWLTQQNYPLQQLDILGNSIGMATSGQGSALSTAPNPFQSNNAANYLGAGLSTAGLLSSY